VKKKLVLFIPSIEGGGVEKNLFLICKYLSRKQIKVYLVTTNLNIKKNFTKNIKVISPKSNFWSKKSRKFKTLISLILLIKYFYNKKIFILSFQSNISCIFISKIFNFKIIIRLNTSLQKYIRNPISKIFYKHIYGLANNVVVNSSTFRSEVKKILNLDAKTIYNPTLITAKNKKINFFKNFKGLKILNIGRLTDQKNQIILVKSLKLLNKKFSNFRCCIIGKGKEKVNLLNFIKKSKLDKKIKLIGYKKNAVDYIKNSDIFVLTSKYEGLPNVLIEAQTKSIPIISSDCPTGPYEILLGGKLGDLFNVDDYKKLCQLLLNFVKDKSRLIKKTNLSKKYLSRFDYKTNCGEYLKMINKLY
jgi:glycosyltransferase involved in cell wall biosynthesis